MRRAFDDATVTGYHELTGAMTCDEKDRHVLAAAVRANTAVLVTANRRDFPPSSVDPYDIRVLHPDDFLLDQVDLYPEVVVRSLRKQAEAMRNPPLTLDTLLDALARCGVPDFAARVRTLVE